MAASATVPQLPQFRNLLAPRHGVVTLIGYGIKVYVDRGHLTVEDGIGIQRHKTCFPRVGHGIRRLVVIGCDGLITLAAINWLSNQDAAFVMLERDGSVLATVGPVRPSDARLRRAQALAHQSGVALRIVRELISRKLAGQEKVVRTKLIDSRSADMIARAHSALAAATNIPAIRQLEAEAALHYWSAWRDIPVVFPKQDLPRVPEHWYRFGSRHSPLTNSPRLAVNPPNAILNYLYALLESEARLALAALGLDPGLGVLHADEPRRDSLACDVMEAVRPEVDAYLLDWIIREPLNRKWFFEQRDGNCRLMGSFAIRLSETAPTWGRAVAPIAEWVSRTIWAATREAVRQVHPATRLTQSSRRQAKGGPAGLPLDPAPEVLRVCRTCGETLKGGHKYCASCRTPVSREALIEAAKVGRIVSHSPMAEARRASTMQRHEAAKRAWRPSDQPDWLDETAYREKVLPRLAAISLPAISSALGISEAYTADIRGGRRLPHRRHWQTLARLVGLSQHGDSD